MEVPLSTILVLMVVIASVASLAFYVANRFPGTASQFDEVKISNVVPFSRYYYAGRGWVSEYLINYRAVCQDAPLYISRISVSVVLDNGNHDEANVVLRGNHGTGRGRYISVNVYLDGLVLCGDLGGYDHTTRILVSAPMRAYIEYVSVYARHPDGSVWRAVIYLPEKALPFPGGG